MPLDSVLMVKNSEEIDWSYRMPSGINHGKSVEEVFWQNVKKTNDCWAWYGKLFRNGYGCFCVLGRYLLAHRVSWQLHKGLPSGVVCHKCDNRPCIRPDHLFDGSQVDNMQDMILKGRGNFAFGERAGNSKLTTKQVKEIRHRHDEGELQKTIALDYPVSQKQISVIVNDVQWRAR